MKNNELEKRIAEVTKDILEKCNKYTEMQLNKIITEIVLSGDLIILSLEDQIKYEMNSGTELNIVGYPNQPSYIPFAAKFKLERKIERLEKALELCKKQRDYYMNHVAEGLLADIDNKEIDQILNDGSEAT
jgi:hypothetical protein